MLALEQSLWGSLTTLSPELCCEEAHVMEETLENQMPFGGGTEMKGETQRKTSESHSADVGVREPSSSGSSSSHPASETNPVAKPFSDS